MSSTSPHLSAREHTFSPRELATAVGVSESSMKRWIDAGELEAARTAGGHRRVSQREAVRFIRERALHVVDPAALRLPELVGLPDIEAAPVTAEGLIEALVAGEAARARALVVAAYVGGASLASLCDGPLRGALHHAGMLWENGGGGVDPSGIGIEHEAVDVFVQILHQIRTLRPLAPDGAPVAVGGAFEGDPYTVPSLMAAAVLEDLGFDVTNLGPNTPIDVLADAARRRRADLVWLSVSASPPDEELRRASAALATELNAAGARFVVGGREAKADALPGLTVLPSMLALNALAEQIMAERRAA
ncbi:MAG: cobalamin-dependent protein [Rhodothermales bacterium]